MDVLATPAANEPTPTRSGPACTACGEPAVVHWLRRLTDAELAEHLEVERARRDELLLLADPQLPAPDFGPMPTGDGFTRTVYACGPHAITMDAASLIHASACTAPNDADLPGCDCTPEPLPQPEPAEDPAPALPAHWVTGGA